MGPLLENIAKDSQRIVNPCAKRQRNAPLSFTFRDFQICLSVLKVIMQLELCCKIMLLFSGLFES